MQWPSWNSNQEYNIGDSVNYQGQVYHIIQPHISQSDWTPSQCPALWGLGGPAGSELGKKPVPQDRHSPPPYHRGGQGDDRMPGMGFDHRRDGPKEERYGNPQPEHHRGIPAPEPPRGVPEPDRHRGFPDQDRRQGPPNYTPGDRGNDRELREKDHDRDWREKDNDRDWREKDDDRDRDREREREREHPRDREFGSRDREQVYEAEDRATREGHNRGQGDGEYRNPTKYKSSAEWIDDARRRTREVNMNGPGERIFWLLAEPGEIPKHAIQAGEDKEGNPTFVARNFHEGGLHIGWAGLRSASFSYGGREIPLTTFEVLVGDPHGVRWAASKRRDGRPIEAGYEANGKPLWICQTMIGGQILAGKTAGWDSGGYIATEGREQAVPEYNILCHS